MTVGKKAEQTKIFIYKHSGLFVQNINQEKNIYNTLIDLTLILVKNKLKFDKHSSLFAQSISYKEQSIVFVIKRYKISFRVW